MTDIASQDTFFTDSNGREMQQRNLNFRPTWDLNVTHPISGKYLREIIPLVTKGIIPTKEIIIP